MTWSGDSGNEWHLYETNCLSINLTQQSLISGLINVCFEKWNIDFQKFVEKKSPSCIFFQIKVFAPCRWPRSGYPINFDPSLRTQRLKSAFFKETEPRPKFTGPYKKICRPISDVHTSHERGNEKGNGCAHTRGMDGLRTLATRTALSQQITPEEIPLRPRVIVARLITLPQNWMVHPSMSSSIDAGVTIPCTPNMAQQGGNVGGVFMGDFYMDENYACHFENQS